MEVIYFTKILDRETQISLHLAKVPNLISAMAQEAESV
jgi:hypothetical protein